MDGIILVDKPINKTSSKVILEIKRKFNFKKVGHAGTLDPLATGLLVVLINKATKLSNYLLTADKKYQVTMKLFVETNSGDITGKLIKWEGHKVLKKKNISASFNYFDGFTYDQYPSIFSAIKYKGKQLYKYARANEEVKIKPRKVMINSITSVNYSKKRASISFIVSCSKGTYVRSLVKDIAKKMGTIATVSELRRIQSGNFVLSNAKTLDSLNPKKDIISMYDALLKNKYIIIQHHDKDAIKYGKSINIINHNEPFVFIVDNNKKILAIYKHVFEHMYICARGI